MDAYTGIMKVRSEIEVRERERERERNENTVLQRSFGHLSCERASISFSLSPSFFQLFSFCSRLFFLHPCIKFYSIFVFEIFFPKKL